MKKLFRLILRNAKADIFTSVIGCVAGSDDLINGIATNDKGQIIKGVAIILFGLISKTNDTPGETKQTATK